MPLASSSGTSSETGLMEMNARLPFEDLLADRADNNNEIKI